MVVEELFRARWAEKRSANSFFLGVLFTLISFATSFLLFKNSPGFIGVSTVLFTVILIVPVVNKLFDFEEKIEVKYGLSFFDKHRHIIDFFIYFFIGEFIVLFFIALGLPNMVFSEQQLYGVSSMPPQYERKLPFPPAGFSDYENILRLLKNNVYVMLISFALSLFYGSGALFLITLNASVFASALAKVVRLSLPSSNLLLSSSFTLCNIGLMFFHTIPEVSGYLIAAIAGGVLSHAFIREKRGGRNFKIVLLDSVALLIISLIVLIAAAFLENGLSRRLLTGDACMDKKFAVLLVLGIVMGSLVLFEVLRKKKVLVK